MSAWAELVKVRLWDKVGLEEMIDHKRGECNLKTESTLAWL